MTHLDGNVLGGLLAEVFGVDLTAARGACASCGAVAELGAALAYTDAPGAVLRCARCESVVLRVVKTRTRVLVDFRGLRYVELEAREP